MSDQTSRRRHVLLSRTPCFNPRIRKFGILISRILIIPFFITVAVISLSYGNENSREHDIAVVETTINTNHIHAYTSSYSFICATLDWWPPFKCDYGTCSWGHASIINLDLKNSKLTTAVKALSPFILRLGGSLQDHIIYEVGWRSPKCNPITFDPSSNFNFKGGCLNMSRWLDINQLCINMGCQIAFGLNGLRGRVYLGERQWFGYWNSDNAEDLIRFSAEHNLPIYSWQLGNELGGPSGIAANISAEQYGADVINLRTIIDNIYKSRKSKSPYPLLGAADNYYDEEWYSKFLNFTGRGVVNVVTRHNYLLGAGVDADVEDRILSYGYLAGDEHNYAEAWSGISKLDPSASLWIGESGGAYNSGKDRVTNSFVSGFWYLDQLGLAASYNHSTHCRQSLIGGNYGLLNTSTFEPNPDFFSAFFFKRLMGPKVLQITSVDPHNIRVYSHCQADKQGVVAILAINLDRTLNHNLTVHLSNNDSLGNVRRDFHFTAKDGNIHSQDTIVNGRLLTVKDLERYEDFGAVVDHGKNPIRMAPLSYSFFVFPEARVVVCGG